MDRDTKTVSAGSHEFVVKTYATAREHQAIQQSYFNGTKLEIVGDQPKVSEFNPGVQFEVQKEMVRQMVVLVDGSDENILDRCLDLPSDDFDALSAELDAIVSKKKS